MLPTETTVSLADGSHTNEKSNAEDNIASQITPTINGSTKHSHVSTFPFLIDCFVPYCHRSVPF